MSSLLRGVLSRDFPQASPIPAGTPDATPNASQVVLASTVAGADEKSAAHNQLESGNGRDTALYMQQDHESCSQPRSISPEAPQSSEPSHSTMAIQRPDQPAARQSKGSKSKMARRMKAINPRLVLENSGSVARDHLASERTFLAYVRTSLAIASAGVALVQLFTIADLTSRGLDDPLSDASREVQKFARPLGIVAVVFAFIVLVIGMYRYFLIQRALPEQKFPTARVSVAFTSFVLGAVIVIIFAALLKGRMS